MRKIIDRLVWILAQISPVAFNYYTGKKRFWGGGIIRFDIEKAISRFNGGRGSFGLKKDILKAYQKYGTTADEYFLFGYMGRGEDYRSAFLADKYKDIYSINCSKGELSGIEVYHDLSDKYNFYCKYKKYFNRAAIKITDVSDLEAFMQFVNAHSQFIIKPLTGSLGGGVQRDCVSGSRPAKEVFDDWLANGKWSVEELINQKDEMALWNATSINTVRIPSIRSSKGIIILQPFFRTGREGMVVDNAGAGGIFATLDAKTGIVISNGLDESGNTYERHPDSNMKYIGYHIPEWEGLLAIANKIHNEMPCYHKYVAFDFAYSERGWVLVEANWGQFLGQYASKIGIRNQFEELMMG